MTMSTRLSRRQFVTTTLAASTFPLTLGSRGAFAAAAPAAGPDALLAYQDGPQVWVRWNNRVLLSYRAHTTQKYPYVYPLAGPLTGLSLTAETGLPWPHHRSLFFGCDRVNGGDYWAGELGKGHIRSTGLKLGATTKDAVEILDTCEWRKPDGAVVMKDERRLVVRAPGDRLWFLDWEILWSAVVPTRIEKTNHSLFSLRAAPDLTPGGGGRLVNAEGFSGEKATFGLPSAWCDFSGQRERVAGNVVEGIALLDHPRNPWAPCPWFTRDYGFISPTPLNFIEKPLELAAGKSCTLRYRVVLHAGDARDAGLARIFKEWAAA
jgi:hypothetical protein